MWGPPPWLPTSALTVITQRHDRRKLTRTSASTAHCMQHARACPWPLPLISRSSEPVAHNLGHATAALPCPQFTQRHDRRVQPTYQHGRIEVRAWLPPLTSRSSGPAGPSTLATPKTGTPSPTNGGLASVWYCNRRLYDVTTGSDSTGSVPCREPTGSHMWGLQWQVMRSCSIACSCSRRMYDSPA